MGFFSKDIKTLDDLFVHTLRALFTWRRGIPIALVGIPLLAGHIAGHESRAQRRIGRFCLTRFSRFDSP